MHVYKFKKKYEHDMLMFYYVYIDIQSTLYNVLRAFECFPQNQVCSTFEC